MKCTRLIQILAMLMSVAPVLALTPASTPPSATGLLDVSLTSAALSRMSPTSGTLTGTSSHGRHRPAPAHAVHVGVLQPINEGTEIGQVIKNTQVAPGTDVRVGCRLTEAAAWYEMDAGTLGWREATGSESNHLMITIQDAGDGRVIPGCKVSASLTNAADKEIVTSTTLPFIWSKEFYYYGTNILMPEETTGVTVHVKVEPPDFRRRGKQLGAFFNETVHATFANVEITSSSRTATSTTSSTEPERVIFPEGRHPAITPTPYPGSISK